MCGITGLLVPPGSRSADSLRDAVLTMTRAIRHRGPDGEGVWIDADAGVALGHRRLAILDPTPDGAQPMTSASGRYVMVFNGEIYNFPALADELRGRGHQFRTRSDTEVLLAALEEWGPQAVARCHGIFALAAWDRERRSLVLARDHLGVKPLAYGVVGEAFVFASELHAIRRMPGAVLSIDADALAAYLRYNCIPAPYTVYRGIHKLLPGHWAAVTPGHEPHPEAYWSARAIAESGTREPAALDDAAAIEALDATLRGVVTEQLISDVPVGAFLSGGVDSSAVVAIMRQVASGPVRTFSIGFDDPEYDEAGYARAVARHLGTEHTELIVSGADALAAVPKLATLCDEPFADASQLPTYLVAALARRDVTVALSGDGGDELFGGYNRHALGERWWPRVERVPYPVRAAAAGALGGLPEGALAWIGRRVLPRSVGPARAVENVRKVTHLLTARDRRALYTALVSHWKRPAAVVRGAREPMTAALDPARWAAVPSFAEAMMYLDTVSYLPDDVLTKVDRATMAVGLEARVPLLDPALVAFAWRLPLRQKIRDGQGKWILRQVLHRYVPVELVDRPKAGFAVPVARWLRGELRDWAESLLDDRRLREEGVFDPAPIRAAWRDHLAGRGNWAHRLWSILMFQAWHGESTRAA